jgi:predicted outer membrane repeat protein
MTAARTGDTVLVADGVYFEGGLAFAGLENFTVRSRNGPENCIIDGRDRALLFWFVVDETPQAVIEGFTITNGRGDWGGAVYCHHDGAPTFINCAFTNNTAGWGGAIGCDTAGSPTFIDCLFEGNTATRGGGGAIIGDTDGPGPRLINCTLRNNTALTNGGAVSIRSVGTEPMLIDCNIVNNTAGGNGGAVYSGGFRSGDLLINCTVADNTANGLGGGLFVDAGNGPVTATNSIFWGNSGTQIIGGAAAVTYSNAQGGFNGIGNIDDDPQFVDPNSGDYHISSGSPAINAGNPNFLSPPGDTDIDGQKRVWNGRVDMGSDEFGSFAFGDLNCDGAIDAFDIEPFLLALFEPGQYAGRFPDCDIELADTNADGRVNAFDIEPFLDLLFGP